MPGTADRSTFYFHRKALGWFATLPSLPHGHIRRLDMAAETPGVEQRMSQPVGGEPRAQLADESRVGRKAQRERFVVGERGRHQLRQPDRVEQARCDARSE